MINAADFDHDQHELFDKADADLVPPRSAKGKAGDTADVKEFLKQVAMAEARADEAESAREEMKVRAEAAEKDLAKLADGKKKSKPMVLTEAQKVAIRRYAGFAAYAHYGWVFEEEYGTLELRMQNFSAEEEAVITGNYLAVLPDLESAITDASCNLDTDEAAVWKHNRNEIADRTALYNQKRRELCSFIGVRPGRGLGAGAYVVGSRTGAPVWPNCSTVPRFQPPPRRTQHADFPHCAPPFASCRGLWDLSCQGNFRPVVFHSIAVEQLQGVVQPRPTPSLPTESPVVSEHAPYDA